MDKWNASLDQSVIRVLLEFQGNQDCWVKLERKVKKERVALSVTQQDFVDPPGHRGPQEIEVSRGSQGPRARKVYLAGMVWKDCLALKVHQG